VTAPAPDAPEQLALVERVHRFVDELRARGLPVSMIERIDAMRAIEGTALDNRHGLHTALGATLIKSGDHLAVFDEVFQLYFRARTSSSATADGDGLADIEAGGSGSGSSDGDGRGAGAMIPIDLDHALRSVLLEGSDTLARLVAEQAVAQFAQFEPGRPVAGIQYESRALRGLRLEQISTELMRAAGGGSGGEPGSGSGGEQPGTGSSGSARPFALTYDQNLISDRAQAMRELIREVIRELLVGDRGVDAVAKTIRTPLPTDVVISMANPAQLAEIERVMQPLQRKLATTVMRKRRSKRGPLDVRATLRSSMATGGIPVRVVHRRPTPTKPKLYVLADVSGSVATFAAFTITLVSAISELFSRLRTFAFVENAVEVTELFERLDNPLDAVKAINRMEGLNFYDAHTDYGRTIRQFWAEVGPTLTARSTVLIFGDARGNYRPAEEETFAHIAKRAGAVYWLNPESQAQWGSGDSLMDVYAGYCTKAVACRTLTDLRRFVEDM
jgi:uncharacterized protein with von Willebrand factor type A (vWA) domain